MNKKCLPSDCKIKTVLSNHKLADSDSEKLLRASTIGTEIVFADRSVLIEEFVPTTMCKKCAFDSMRDQFDGPVCNRFNLCSARYRKDKKSVCFVDEGSKK